MENWFGNIEDEIVKEKIKRMTRSIVDGNCGNVVRRLSNVDILFDQNVGYYVKANVVFYSKESGNKLNEDDVVLCWGQYGILDINPELRGYLHNQNLAYDIQSTDSEINQNWIAGMIFENCGKRLNDKTYIESVKQNYMECIYKAQNEEIAKIEKKYDNIKKSINDSIQTVVTNIIEAEE